MNTFNPSLIPAMQRRATELRRQAMDDGFAALSRGIVRVWRRLAGRPNQRVMGG